MCRGPPRGRRAIAQAAQHRRGAAQLRRVRARPARYVACFTFEHGKSSHHGDRRLRRVRRELVIGSDAVAIGILRGRGE
jgi:hypothetical protein